MSDLSTVGSIPTRRLKNGDILRAKTWPYKFEAEVWGDHLVLRDVNCTWFNDETTASGIAVKGNERLIGAALPVRFPAFAKTAGSLWPSRIAINRKVAPLMVDVRSASTGQSISFVPVIDRGPDRNAPSRALVDLTPRAFTSLGHSLKTGNIAVDLTVRDVVQHIEESGILDDGTIEILPAKTATEVVPAGVATPLPPPATVPAHNTAFSIVNHRLAGVRYLQSPNIGGPLAGPSLLVMHTTDGTLDGSITTFMDARKEVSAHILIDRDGTVVQMVPFHLTAWHCGNSAWRDKRQCNHFSIGIELVTGGKLKGTRGDLRTYWGEPVPDAEAVFTRHALESEPAWWHSITFAQRSVAVQVSQVICTRYGLGDIEGHYAIAPQRKLDPWPLDMAAFRRDVRGTA